MYHCSSFYCLNFAEEEANYFTSQYVIMIIVKGAPLSDHKRATLDYRPLRLGHATRSLIVTQVNRATEKKAKQG